jgi:hypothetical protein
MMSEETNQNKKSETEHFSVESGVVDGVYSVLHKPTKQIVSVNENGLFVNDWSRTEAREAIELMRQAVRFYDEINEEVKAEKADGAESEIKEVFRRELMKVLGTIQNDEAVKGNQSRDTISGNMTWNGATHKIEASITVTSDTFRHMPDGQKNEIDDRLSKALAKVFEVI